MGVLGRLLLSRQQRQDAEKARQIIEAAFIESREPRSCAEAAASGADIRRRLFSVVDRLEAEMGQLVRCFQNNAPMGSCCIVDFVAPSVDHWLAIDVADEGDQAFLEFVFAADADVAQHRTRQLGEEALDEIEP